MTWQTIPQSILNDCAQLVKANSIEGNKRDNITVIFTPAGNLKKTGAMEVGQVGFHDERKVRAPPGSAIPPSSSLLQMVAVNATESSRHLTPR